jgi:hypothetical protein
MKDEEWNTVATKMVVFFGKKMYTGRKNIKLSVSVENVCLNSHEIAILNSVGQPTFPHLETTT